MAGKMTFGEMSSAVRPRQCGRVPIIAGAERMGPQWLQAIRIQAVVEPARAILFDELREAGRARRLGQIEALDGRKFCVARLWCRGRLVEEVNKSGLDGGHA